MTNTIDQALAALGPFAEYAAMYDECEQHPGGCPDRAMLGEVTGDLTVGDLRRARQVHEALQSLQEGEGEAQSGDMLDRDHARLALFNAIGAITIGNKHDDKLILDNLRDAGFWICAVGDIGSTVANVTRGFGKAQEGWRTIDSAPKDGTEIDVWAGEEFPRRVPNVSWRVPSDSEWWVHGGDTIETADATWHDCFGPLGKSEQPTHWMPLPPAPGEPS